MYYLLGIELILKFNDISLLLVLNVLLKRYLRLIFS